MDYLADIATNIGVSIWLLTIILIWTLFWKLMAMWKSARNGHVFWFIILVFINTVGILPILYIYVFSKMNYRMKPRKKKIRRKKK